MRETVLTAFSNALHPVFLVAAGAALVAVILAWMMPELPLANTLRREPEAEIKSGEEAAAAAAGAPA